MSESACAIQRALDALMYFNNLELNKERGFSITEQDLEEQINAAPISGRDDAPVASNAVAGSSYRFTRAHMLEIGSDLVSTARQISQEIYIASLPLTNSSIKHRANIASIRWRFPTST